MVPNATAMVPVYKNILNFPVLNVNLINTNIPMWIMYGASAFKIIVFKSFFDGLPQALIEAARIDGCGWFKELTRIIVPTVWPTVATVVILSTAGFLGATGPVLLFTQGSFGTMTLSYYIYALVSGIGGNQDLYLASAVGFLMTIVSFPIALIVKRVIYGKEDD